MLTLSERIMLSICERAKRKPNTYVSAIDIASDVAADSTTVVATAQELKESGLLYRTASLEQFALTIEGAAWCNE